MTWNVITLEQNIEIVIIMMLPSINFQEKTTGNSRGDSEAEFKKSTAMENKEQDPVYIPKLKRDLKSPLDKVAIDPIGYENWDYTKFEDNEIGLPNWESMMKTWPRVPRVAFYY